MDIDWENLGFKFMPARSNIRFHYADGKWDDGTLTGSYDITVSVAANAFHYGQAIFEGGKAFRCKDGKVRIFRPEENGRRLNRSASHLLMPEFPVDKFVEAVKTVVRDNADFVPPYGTGGALYIRPVMFGTTPQIGVGASLEYELIIMVVPVGAYYKGGIKPVDAMISRDYDRAAPHGTRAYQGGRQLCGQPDLEQAGEGARLRGRTVPRPGHAHVHRRVRHEQLPRNHEGRQIRHERIGFDPRFDHEQLAHDAGRRSRHAGRAAQDPRVGAC